TIYWDDRGSDFQGVWIDNGTLDKSLSAVTELSGDLSDLAEIRLRNGVVDWKVAAALKVVVEDSWVHQQTATNIADWNLTTNGRWSQLGHTLTVNHYNLLGGVFQLQGAWTRPEGDDLLVSGYTLE